MDKIHFYDEYDGEDLYNIKIKEPSETIDFDTERYVLENYIKHNNNFYEQRAYAQNVDDKCMEYYFIKTNK